MQSPLDCCLVRGRARKWVRLDLESEGEEMRLERHVRPERAGFSMMRTSDFISVKRNH